jgi:4-diphosphocytidyl-2-C-methyl-D-erythritol kinase
VRLVAWAPAKVNLGLEVLGRRSDGYHALVTILQTVSLADELSVSPSEDLTLVCDDPSLAVTENLVLRAAHLLRASTGTSQGAHLELHKAIPAGAGLGGGSSDAAAALRLLRRAWDLDLDDRALQRLAGHLGADVAFFLRGGTQLATGRGDELEPLPTPALWIVLIPIEGGADKTSRLYRALRPDDWSDGSRVTALAARLRSGQGWEERGLPNAFERVALATYPVIGEVWRLIRDAGGEPVLCGAGPSVVSIHRDREQAERIAAFVRSAGWKALVVRSLGPGEWPDVP